MYKHTQAFVSSSVWVLQCRDGGERADASSSWHLVTSVLVPHDSITSSQIRWVPPWQKALCKTFAERQSHHTKHTSFSVEKKNLKKGKSDGINTRPNFLCLKGFALLPRVDFPPLCHTMNIPFRDGHQWQGGLMGLERKKKKEVGGVKLKQNLLGKLPCMKRSLCEDFPGNCGL